MFIAKIIGIYSITSPTNKVYIGQSWDINRRFNEYRKLNCKTQSALYYSLLKHGVDKHKFDILFYYNGNSQKELNNFEFFYYYRSILRGIELLNLKEAYGSAGKLSQLTKDKIKEKTRGLKRNNLFKLKHSGEKNVNRKLNGEQIKLIYELLSQRKTFKEIGKKFNVTPRTISEIKNGLTWKITDLDFKGLANPLINVGNANPSAKLSEDQVKEICKLIAEGHSNSVLADKYNVSKTTIFNVRSGKKWKHITASLIVP
jgi:group I intron endonuclease